jgi:hypothetical protein
VGKEKVRKVRNCTLHAERFENISKKVPHKFDFSNVRFWPKNDGGSKMVKKLSNFVKNRAKTIQKRSKPVKNQSILKWVNIPQEKYKILNIKYLNNSAGQSCTSLSVQKG